MCARLLSCPLCSQPGFLTLDALRTGLVSVATRPLICPACNEILLGIDKLTIHLFGHTMGLDNVRDEINKVIRTSCASSASSSSSTSSPSSSSLSSSLSTSGISININDTDNPANAQNILHENLPSGNNWSESTLNVTGDTIASVLQPEKIGLSIEPKENERENGKKGECEKVNGFVEFTGGWIENCLDHDTCHGVSKENESRNIEEKNDSIANNDNCDTSKESYLEEKKEKAENVLPQWKNFRILTNKEKTERCNICGFHFADSNILLLHKKLVHMIDEKDVNVTPEDLMKNYPCHLCSKVFKMRGSLMVHMRVAHIGYNLGTLAKDGEVAFTVNDNGYNCPTCGKNFKKEQHVIQHMKTHEGKQWECDVCSKMFTTKYFLKKHKRLHSGEMPYKCGICEKTFTFQQSYHKHRLYHKDDKPHTCNTCGRSFKELSTLHNHERIHTGEKPFACETCGKCFRQRVSYLVHRRIHTGVMPYKCDSCGKSFRYKVSQRTHKCPVQPPGNNVEQNKSRSVGNNASVDVNETGNYVDSNRGLVEIPLGILNSDSRDNKFVLIVDTKGQHVLTRQSDLHARSNNFTQANDKNNEDFTTNSLMWENKSNAEERENVKNKKTIAEDVEGTTDDFFSMVMSPPIIENTLALSSPTIEMEHLTLASPPGKVDEAFVIHRNPNIVDVNHEKDICGDNQNLCARNNSIVDSSLHTINEESLQRLLYAIDGKE